VRYFGRDVEPATQVFVPFQQNPYRFLPYAQEPFVSVVLRTAGDARSLVKAMQTRIWAVDKDEPILHTQTMEHALSQSLVNRRSYSVLLGCIATIALLMAVAGIYGLVAYSVASRTKGMGVRVTLGANLRQIVTLMLRNSMILTFVGVGLGIAGSLAVRKVLSGLLYGISATDAPTFVGVALLFEIVVLLAAYISARRAATIDPCVHSGLNSNYTISGSRCELQIAFW
jgi:putative ABC transport system permease protein